jgi:dTDP-glucose 4,6-dehydratase
MPFFRTNVSGTGQVLESVRKFGKRLHHVSTDEVFGDLAIGSQEKFNRRSEYRPSSPYSASKASSDLMVRAWCRTYGLEATISNCSNNFGPYQNQEKLIPQIISRIKTNQKPQLYGTGLNVRDWIHVDEHNEGVWAIIDKGSPGSTYLLGADNLRSNIQVAQAILKHVGLPLDYYELIGDRPGHDRQYAIDASESITELGWTPKQNSFEDQLGPVVDFYVNS